MDTLVLLVEDTLRIEVSSLTILRVGDTDSFSVTRCVDCVGHGRYVYYVFILMILII